MLPPPPPPPTSFGGLVTEQEVAAVLAGLDTFPGKKIGTDVPEGALVQYSVKSGATVVQDSKPPRCCICLEEFPVSDLYHCGRTSCGDRAFCHDCLRQHAESVIDSALYAAPCVRCPVCNMRLATKAWAPLVQEEKFSKYKENARALLTYRCAACDETGSYLPTSSFEEGSRGGAFAGSQGKYPFAMLDSDARQRLSDIWQQFFLADASAETFLQAVLDEFSCGHRCGGHPPSSMSKVLGPSGEATWIEDLERRLAMQMAWMHRFPRQRTPCCGEQFCFKCKVSSWHRGVTCNERLQSEKARQAQSCPGCGVPTQRSEGCRKITCVCGRVWEWAGGDGEESSEDEGAFSESGDEEDEMPQAQTPLNLAAMNCKASDETVRTLIQALVNAGADVNDWPSETRSPLLLAVQCRHITAVSALCDMGARVTPEVLEELKNISEEKRRCDIEKLLRPQVQGDPNMRLPLWVWIQAGSAAAVEALLRNAAHEEVVGEDVFVALQRSSGDEPSRKLIAEHLREHVGEDQFQKLQVSSATRRLLMELRQALDEERDVEIAVVREALGSGADPNARERESSDGDDDGNLGFTGLSLLAMNYKASAESVSSSIEALLEAGADTNAEVDEGSTALLLALRHRCVAAIEALCKATVSTNYSEGGSSSSSAVATGAPPRIISELVDEVGCLSEDSRRRKVEELLQPLLRGSCSGGKGHLPLWIWVQDGCAAAVEALLRNADEQVCVEDLVALQRCRGDEAARERIKELLRWKCGDEESFRRLEAEAATRRLLQELREAYDDQRDVNVDIVRNTLEQGADASAQEEEEAVPDFTESGSYSLSALQIVVTNQHISPETMQAAVSALIEAGAEVNAEVGGSDTPLFSALQSRCVAGAVALGQHGARVTADVLEELKAISSTKVRHDLDDTFMPLIAKDKSLRCPLWVWVQSGAVSATEALVRNAAHDEDIDADVLVALQRCRGTGAEKEQISTLLKEHVGQEEYQRLEAAGATKRLLMELREAYTEERDPELDVICDALSLGANPNAQEEDGDEDVDEDEEGEEDEEDDRESMDDDEDGDDDETPEDYGEDEPEGEMDEES